MLIGELGVLVKQDIRKTWEHEAQDFTPWLAKPENLKLLGEALGLSLVSEESQVSVGRFYADLICRDEGSGYIVLVENQLEGTDHSHLGQILTYAAGVKSGIMVWIAKYFTSEHRAALDWLNRNTLPEIRFFGVELEVWKIQGSELKAPKFNVVVQPNDWVKPVMIDDGYGKLQYEFWCGLFEYLDENYSEHPFKYSPNKHVKWLSNIWFPPILTGIHLALYVAKDTTGAYLRLTDPDRKDRFNRLKENRLTLDLSSEIILEWVEEVQNVKNPASWVLAWIKGGVKNKENLPHRYKLIAEAMFGLDAFARKVLMDEESSFEASGYDSNADELKMTEAIPVLPPDFT